MAAIDNTNDEKFPPKRSMPPPFTTVGNDEFTFLRTDFLESQDIFLRYLYVGTVLQLFFKRLLTMAYFRRSNYLRTTSKLLNTPTTPFLYSTNKRNKQLRITNNYFLNNHIFGKNPWFHPPTNFGLRLSISFPQINTHQHTIARVLHNANDKLDKKNGGLNAKTPSGFPTASSHTDFFASSSRHKACVSFLSLQGWVCNRPFLTKLLSLSIGQKGLPCLSFGFECSPASSSSPTYSRQLDRIAVIHTGRTAATPTQQPTNLDTMAQDPSPRIGTRTFTPSRSVLYYMPPMCTSFATRDDMQSNLKINSLNKLPSNKLFYTDFQPPADIFSLNKFPLQNSSKTKCNNNYSHFYNNKSTFHDPLAAVDKSKTMDLSRKADEDPEKENPAKLVQV